MAKRRITSRLAKKESRRMTKQTILLILLSIGVVALFVFVVVPNVIKLFFSMIDNGSAFDQVDNIPPQPPVIRSPVEATSSAKLKFAGYGEPDSNVVLVVNNEKQAKVEVGEDGMFEASVDLTEGENSLSLYSVDQADNESIAKRYQVLLDSVAPSLEIESPADGAQIELEKNRVVEIKGKTEAKAKVYVNGRITLANEEGQFSYSYRLEDGENKIEIKAQDLAGNQTTQELTLNFKD